MSAVRSRPSPASGTATTSARSARRCCRRAACPAAVATMPRVPVPPRKARAPAGSSPRRSSNTGTGGIRGVTAPLAVSIGSSAFQVRVPTSTASNPARSRCTSARDRFPVSQTRLPPPGAILPSRLTASLSATYGPRAAAAWKNAGFAAIQSARVPNGPSTRTPRVRSHCPPPPCFDPGSAAQNTTRAMPAAWIASVHGGVFPAWLHGSRLL